MLDTHHAVRCCQSVLDIGSMRGVARLHHHLKLRRLNAWRREQALVADLDDVAARRRRSLRQCQRERLVSVRISIRRRSNRPSRSSPRSSTFAMIRTSMLPPQTGMPTCLPAKRLRCASRPASAAAPAPSATTFAPSASMDIASSTLRSEATKLADVGGDDLARLEPHVAHRDALRDRRTADLVRGRAHALRQCGIRAPPARRSPLSAG